MSPEYQNCAEVWIYIVCTQQIEEIVSLEDNGAVRIITFDVPNGSTGAIGSTMKIQYNNCIRSNASSHRIL